jgi:fructose-1,6-bisphosphatase II
MHNLPETPHIPRNLGLDLVRSTETAALAAARFMGLGKPEEADDAAIQAMHATLDSLDLDGTIVVGEEGRLGDVSDLGSGQRVGTGKGPAVDVVLDPIDGRRLLASGQSGAISVAALAPLKTMWTCSPANYMEKIVANQQVGEALIPECLDAPAAWTLSLIARQKSKKVQDLVVFILDRPRHRDLIDEIRAVGARVILQQDGDIAGALLAASSNDKVDVLMGIGGVEEGIIAACGVKALGGAMLVRLAPQSAIEQKQVQEAGLDLTQILSSDELITSEEVFFAATGITDGPLLDGVHFRGRLAETHSLILRGQTHTRRFVRAEHLLQEKT